ncbi:hypothetical protein IFM89_030867 [Coptis chinensis]|uniref:F-box domain-containing protein n=1 Tax=Coptis chinensis TaxID=261450 RepID=A0A835H0H8_9MAGN|nr:hypothetical protein IFM89_030867 [Coptis chinensis]
MMFPQCFTRLPSNLKLRIMEFLPGFEVAKLACVSSELRDVSTNILLWKRKYVEEFSPSNTSNPPRELIPPPSSRPSDPPRPMPTCYNLTPRH